jgi:hypothetical protein
MDCFVASAPLRKRFARLSQAMTASNLNTASRSRRAFRASFAKKLPALRNQRAQGMPGARCTRGLVCNVHKKMRTRAYRFSGEHPTFPAQWFYGLYRALPGDRAFCHRRLHGYFRKSLTPASRRQDHTTSPYVSAPFVKGASASTAPCPASVTIASRPSEWDRMGQSVAMICPTAKAEYFFTQGWTRFTDLPVGSICRACALYIVIASAATQSIELQSKNGLLRRFAPRNDEVTRARPTAPSTDRQNIRSSCDRSWLCSTRASLRNWPCPRHRARPS